MLLGVPRRGHKAYGCFYGPVVDNHYGTRMAIALELIDFTEHQQSDKFEINPREVMPHFVRESLLSWLPPREWKSFNKVMVSLAQILVDQADDDTMTEVKKIINLRFGNRDKVMLRRLVDDIEKVFTRGH